ncbi:hypothetical protein [Microbacterium sp. J1-1]|uniref:hypothetical protein n=1 Tax=Microbacterium sp. J1-1 TaxID=2992441 RepID=UPI002114B970|nr:hypothetical protein [Microbacterium sp. J1-1]UUE19348.1 hypothetical protein LRQ07_11055 [Microbacterium sp. J1-1]
MTSNDGMQPFEPVISAAVGEVEKRIEQIRAEHASRRDQWQARRLAAYWNGDSALVILKPESISPTDLTVTASGALQEYKGGLGVLAVLVRGAASHVVVDYIVNNTAVQMTLPISDL